MVKETTHRLFQTKHDGFGCGTGVDRFSTLWKPNSPSRGRTTDPGIEKERPLLEPRFKFIP